MKKSIAVVLLGLLFIPGMVGAVPAIPKETVWFSPEDATAGDTIVLSALIYNSTQKSATVTVGFFDGSLEIAQTTSAITAQTALALTAQWIFPEEGKKITAKVTKALDGNKRAIPELVGEVGSVTVGTVTSESSGTTASLLKTAKEMLGTVFSFVEPWRKKQAEHFEKLRDEKKVLLGINSAKEAIDALNPIPPEAPAVPENDMSTSETGLEDITPRYQGIDIGGYIVFLYATALATIFASVALFYIVAVLLALFVLKLIIRIVA